MKAEHQVHPQQNLNVLYNILL